MNPGDPRRPVGVLPVSRRVVLERGGVYSPGTCAAPHIGEGALYRVSVLFLKVDGVKLLDTKNYWRFSTSQEPVSIVKSKITFLLKPAKTVAEFCRTVWRSSCVPAHTQLLRVMPGGGRHRLRPPGFPCTDTRCGNCVLITKVTVLVIIFLPCSVFK